MSTEIAFCQHEKQHDNRILYFQILCKLLFADDNITERAFYDFMEPFHRRIEALGSLDTVEAFQQESVKVKLKKKGGTIAYCLSRKQSGTSLQTCMVSCCPFRAVVTLRSFLTGSIITTRLSCFVR